MKVKVNPNDYENQEELVSCAAEDLRDALRETITLEDLEEVAQWLSAYIRAARRLPE